MSSSDEQASDTSDPSPQECGQIKGFVSVHELEHYARKHHLTRVHLKELTSQSDLDNGYIGGWVVGSHANPYSQGHDLDIFVRDESTTDSRIDAKHLLVTIDGTVADGLPTLVSKKYKLFVHRGRLVDQDIDFTQDHNKFIKVDSEESRIWLVHKNAKRGTFFRHKTCKESWFTKTKEHREVSEDSEDSDGETTEESVEGFEQDQPSSSNGSQQSSPRDPQQSSPLRSSPRYPLRSSSKDLQQSSPLRSSHRYPLRSSSKDPQRSSPKDPQQSSSRYPLRSSSKDPQQSSSKDPQRSSPKDPQPSRDTNAHSNASDDDQFSLPEGFGFPDFAFINDLTLDASADSDTSWASSSDSGNSSSVDSDKEWIPKTVKRGKTGRLYEYKKLSDLRRGDKKINIFGVVKDFTRPVQTRGTDMCSVLTLVDESNPLVGVRCINFNRVEDKLPHVRRVGDIVSLHRVNVDDYRMTSQITSLSFSSSLRFSGHLEKSFKVHTGSISYTFSNAEKQRVKELRMWYQKRNRMQLGRKLEAIVPDAPFSLVCQVVRIDMPKEQDCVMLTVWDGTKCPLSMIQRSIAQKHPVYSKSSPAFSAVACGFEQQVILYDKSIFKAATSLKPGAIIILHCVKPVATGASFELSINTSVSKFHDVYSSFKSVIEVIGEKDYSYVELKQELKTATASQDTITSTPHKDAPLLNLSELKSHHEIPIKTHCHVKVMGVLHPSLEDTVRLSCDQCDMFVPLQADMDVDEDGVSINPCSVCVECGQHLSESPNPYCTFVIKLRVTDLTGTELTFYVTNQEAIKLLNGAKPTSYYRHQQARYDLLQTLNSLTGDNRPFECGKTEHPRPWMDCCVVKLNLGGTDCYFVFDTEMNTDCASMEY